MSKISQIAALEKLLADLNTCLLEQQEILNRLDCKVAISKSMLDAIENKIIRLKRAVEEDSVPKK